jgi:hypothetical protein
MYTMFRKYSVPVFGWSVIILRAVWKYISMHFKPSLDIYIYIYIYIYMFFILSLKCKEISDNKHRETEVKPIPKMSFS